MVKNTEPCLLLGTHLIRYLQEMLYSNIFKLHHQHQYQMVNQKKNQIWLQKFRACIRCVMSLYYPRIWGSWGTRPTCSTGTSWLSGALAPSRSSEEVRNCQGHLQDDKSFRLIYYTHILVPGLGLLGSQTLLLYWYPAFRRSGSAQMSGGVQKSPGSPPAR